MVADISNRNRFARKNRVPRIRNPSKLASGERPFAGRVTRSDSGIFSQAHEKVLRNSEKVCSEAKRGSVGSVLKSPAMTVTTFAPWSKAFPFRRRGLIAAERPPLVGDVVCGSPRLLLKCTE